jgi:hypothetical protein
MVTEGHGSKDPKYTTTQMRCLFFNISKSRERGLSSPR